MAAVLDQLRKYSKSDLVDLVKMHLSFLIDVTSEEWDRIVAYVEKEESEEAHKLLNKLEHGKHSQTKYFTSSTSTTSCDSNTIDTCNGNNNNNNNNGNNSNTKLNNKFAPPKEKQLASNIFGNPLTRHSLKQAMLLIDFLNDDDNYKVEGIFRKSGTIERQQDLRFMLNAGARVDLKANRFTPVDVSCVLKEFIQKLPEPLLTINHFELHYELALAFRKGIPDSELESKSEKRLKIVQLLLHLLPELNREFYLELSALLHKVASGLEVTKMDERSLATIFGNHLLCPRSWTPKQVQKNIDVITDAMEFLFLRYDKLFSGPPELVLDARKKLRKYQQSESEPRLGAYPMGVAGAGDQQANKGSGRDQLDGSSRRHHAAGQDTDEERDENNTVVTFCQRKQAEDTITETALAELYAQVQAMPETPQKRKLIKQFNKQNGFGTPMHVTGKPAGFSSKWKSLLPQLLRPKH